MARMVLSEGADVKTVARRLRKAGIVVHQRLGDGSFVVFKKRKAENGKRKGGEEAESGKRKGVRRKGVKKGGS